MEAVVGRAAELTAIEALLANSEPRTTALVLDGEAGIGKTTLWLAGLDRARAAGYRVLSCRPAEVEVLLPFVSLSDLLDPTLANELPGLPPSDRTALEVALGLAVPKERLEHPAVARAALTLLQRLAQERPLLLAIDDVQWLDHASERVLTRAVRGLRSSTVRLLLARRGERGVAPPLDLGRALLGSQLEVVRLEPLTLAELDGLLRGRLGLRLPRPRLVALRKASAGNPLYALELARGASANGFRVPPSLAAVLEGRLRDLPAQAKEVVLLAAAAAHPTRSLLERAHGSLEGLPDAVEGAVLELDGTRVRFGHPLLASVAYESSAPWERREAHQRLAAVATDPEERARNLALGTHEADDDVAAELEEAATLASNRGAPDAAAFLAEHALRLTSPHTPLRRARRQRALAGHLYAAGDQERSRSLLTELVTVLPPGDERARARAQLSHSVPSQLECLALCREGLAEAGDDPSLRSELHFLAAASARRATTLREAADHARQAVDCAFEAGDATHQARALAMLGHVETIGGEIGGIERLERAVEIEATLEELSLHFRPSFLLGITLLYLGRLDSARPLLEEQLERTNARGDEVARGVALSTLAELELRAGNWADAYGHAYDGASLQEQAAPLHDQAHHVLRAARVAAHMGRMEEARSTAERLLALAALHGDRMAQVSARRDLGFMELSLGDPAAAVAVLEPAVRVVTEMGLVLHSAQPFVHDYVEALVATGKADDAEAANALLEQSGQPWEVAIRERGRALIASARGDDEAAAAAAGRSLDVLERLQQPFELGRTLLVQGVIERRAKQRATAREALMSALDVFDTLGAPLWAEKAAAELARIPGRAPRGDELSETQRRIAELAAEGLSNTEIAARLYVTRRTVESNLATIYMKLGIHSRTELARRLAAPS